MNEGELKLRGGVEGRGGIRSEMTSFMKSSLHKVVCNMRKIDEYEK